ncbi:protease-4 [Halolactibacillus halophilus]|uniref:Protease-4 n=1 Tax=Halolactibacillus halophilus TaxID=306540 RepID=A0A1I5N2I0_9BACI|nr:signal peptide peptidase SppA [Halolactibacillus halophilus]GEM01080.1 signal peptidase [Halolactibacillus halophilus]SFP15974.1 protease-4 [Halolactibacillus halophilus]
MTNKRWVAIGLSIIVLIVSLILPAAASIFMADEEDNEDKATDFFTAFIDDAQAETVVREGDGFNRIALIDVQGEMINQQAAPFAQGGYNHTLLLDQLEQIKTDDTVKAILLRVNTPGGGVYESAELTDKIKEVKEARDIPVYTVMESMAASGGYYISAQSEKIFATKETLTGSIGVIMQGFNVSGLLDKLGIEDTTIKSGDLKDLGSTTRPNTEEEIAVLQELVDGMYERFVSEIITGRDMSREQVLDLADGRIYSGAQAETLGLVDEIGYFDDALATLEADFDLSGAEVFQYEGSSLTMFDQFFLSMKQLLPQAESTPLNSIGQTEEAPTFKYLYRGL